LDEAVTSFATEKKLVSVPIQATQAQALARGASTSSLAVRLAVLHEILSYGDCAVLMLDPATVLLQNPLEHLYRDSDLELVTDGWDDNSAYGYDHVADDPSMGWSRFVHGSRMATRDPGFLFAQPTTDSLRTIALVLSRLRAESSPASDATAHAFFNEAILYPSHGSYGAPGATVRVLNYLCFPNSKGFFRFIRSDREVASMPPVAVRLSHHLERAERMQVISKRYHHKNEHALDEFGVASGTSHPYCSKGPSAATVTPDLEALAQRTLVGQPWAWAGVKGLEFHADGFLKTPWGEGRWGVLDAGAAGTTNALRVFSEFAGAKHVLAFDAPEPLRMFVSSRCSDGDVVLGRCGDGR